MNELTAGMVREFLLARYSESIKGANLEPGDVPDTFDLLLEGIIDSFGILEMVSAIEEEFGVQLDLENLDAEEMTVIGPLSRYVAEHAKRAVTD